MAQLAASNLPIPIGMVGIYARTREGEIMTQPDPYGVAINIREIYDELIRASGKLDRLVDQHEAVRTEVADHETRIRLLERGRWPLPSLAVVLSLGALAAAVIPLVEH
jgi:hypothetical protein